MIFYDIGLSPLPPRVALGGSKRKIKIYFVIPTTENPRIDIPYDFLRYKTQPP